jgi:hypothetical protein
MMLKLVYAADTHMIVPHCAREYLMVLSIAAEESPRRFGATSLVTAGQAGSVARIVVGAL